MRKVWLILVVLLTVTAVLAFSDQVLTVLMPIGGGYTIDQEEAISAGFEQTHPNVKVDMTFVGWSDLWNKIVTSIAAGSAPDVMYIGSRWIPELANMGAIIPLDSYITPQKKSMYYPTVWYTVTYKGHIWGVEKSMSTEVFIYNKKLFESAGITSTPTNWDELLTDAKKIYDPSKGIYGIAMAGENFISTLSQFQNYLYANNGWIVDPNTGKVTINATPAVQALTLYKELSQYAQPGIISWKREDLYKLFETGKVGFYMDEIYNVPTFIKDGMDIGLFYVPGGPSSTKPYGTEIITDSMAISSQAKNKELAWEYIDYMTSLQQQTKWDTSLGFIPPMLEESKAAAFQPWYWQFYIKALNYGQAENTGVINWTPTRTIIVDAIQSVLLGNSTPKAALNEAARAIEALQQQ